MITYGYKNTVKPSYTTQLYIQKAFNTGCNVSISRDEYYFAVTPWYETYPPDQWTRGKWGSRIKDGFVLL